MTSTTTLSNPDSCSVSSDWADKMTSSKRWCNEEGSEYQQEKNSVNLNENVDNLVPESKISDMPIR